MSTLETSGPQWTHEYTGRDLIYKLNVLRNHLAALGCTAVINILTVTGPESFLYTCFLCWRLLRLRVCVHPLPLGLQLIRCWYMYSKWSKDLFDQSPSRIGLESKHSNTMTSSNIVSKRTVHLSKHTERWECMCNDFPTSFSYVNRKLWLCTDLGKM